MEVTIGKKHGLRIAFPTLHAPKEYQNDGKPAYSCTLILDPVLDAEDIAEIKKTILEVAAEKWGKAKAEGVVAQLVKKGNIAFVEGPKANGKGEVYDGFQGKFHIGCRNGSDGVSPPLKPTLVGPDRQPLDASFGKPYGGCYVTAKLDIWAQENGWGTRINTSIRGIQFRKDGAPFAGGTAANSDEFEDYSEEAESFFG